MKSFWKFVGIGSFFSTVEEFLTVVLLKGDVKSYVFTLVVLFPVFLTLVYYSSRWLDRWLKNDRSRAIAHYFTYGLLAVIIIEWFLIGLSPWKPNANPLLMAGFQLGMFSFWATVAFAPRMMLDASEIARRCSRGLIRFYVSYFVMVYVIAYALPKEKRFGPVIVMIILGYFTLNYWFVRYIRAQTGGSIREADAKEAGLADDGKL